LLEKITFNAITENPSRTTFNFDQHPACAYPLDFDIVIESDSDSY